MTTIPDEVFASFDQLIDVDKRLWPADILAAYERWMRATKKET